MKKLLIASFTKDSGHYKAAKSIQTAFNILYKDIQVLSVDSTSYFNSFVSKAANKTYMGIISRIPSMWGYLYDNPIWKNRTDFIRKISCNFSSKPGKLLNKLLPEAVVCTQSFACEVFSHHINKNNKDIKLFSVLTDHSVHDYWVNEQVSAYFVPSLEAAKKLQEKGVSQKKIIFSGVPVSPEFYSKKNKTVILDKYGFSLNKPIVLIMGGNKGIGQIEHILEALLKSCENTQFCILCGNNVNLYKSINKIKNFSSRSQDIFNFLNFNHVDEIMDVSNVIVSKPGGITSAEACVKGVPMVLTGSLPGQEKRNERYLSDNGVAVSSITVNDVVSNVCKIINDKELSGVMSQRAKSLKPENSSFFIADQIMKRIL